MDWCKTLAQWEKAILEEGSYIDGIASWCWESAWGFHWGGGHCDELGGGLEDQHRSTETTEVMEVPEAPGASVTAVTTVDAETPVGYDVMNVSEVWVTSDAPETPVITEATLDLETPVAAGATVASDSADASEATEASNASEATVAARATQESVSKPVGQASHV
eukprot:g5511.t1